MRACARRVRPAPRLPRDPPAEGLAVPAYAFVSATGGRRVLRFDSFSKLLASGIRVGFATGPAELISRLNLHTQASNLHTCGLSQAVVSRLFDHWAEAHGGDSYPGFVDHVAGVAELYRQRRDCFVASAKAHLAGLAEWEVPSAGMFVWLRLLGVSDTDALIKEHALSAKASGRTPPSLPPSRAPRPAPPARPPPVHARARTRVTRCVHTSAINRAARSRSLSRSSCGPHPSPNSRVRVHRRCSWCPARASCPVDRPRHTCAPPTPPPRPSKWTRRCNGSRAF